MFKYIYDEFGRNTMTGPFDNYFHKNMFCGNSKPHDVHVWRDLGSLVMIQYNCPGIPEPKVTLSEDHARLVKENQELTQKLAEVREAYEKFYNIWQEAMLKPIFRDMGMSYEDGLRFLKSLKAAGLVIKERDGD